MSVTSHPLTRATDPDWYLDPSNLASLYRYLRDLASEPDDPAYFMEKPWKWTLEWRRMNGEA